MINGQKSLTGPDFCTTMQPESRRRPGTAGHTAFGLLRPADSAPGDALPGPEGFLAFPESRKDGHPALLKKIARTITRHPHVVVVIALLLLIPSIFGTLATKTNYDILSYLPPDLNSSQGEALLEEPFESAATNMLIVEGMPAHYTDKLITEIRKVDGVKRAIWVGNEVGIQVPVDMLPASMRESFYNGDSTMMIIQYDQPGASEATMKSIGEVRKLCNENCFLAGVSVVIKDTKDLADKQVPIYVIIAVVLALIAMSATMESWILPPVFIACIGLAIMYNLGTNVIFGKVSYITKAIAAVLQLGTTTDYSIFLYHRYEEEKANFADKRDAMAAAVEAAFLSLSGSSLTTVAGFAALCFMRLLLGRDIGLVMAKGVLLGVLTVVFILPAVLLEFDGLITKFRHPHVMPNLDKVNTFIIRRHVVFAVLFALLFIPAVYSQSHASMYYNLDRSLPDDMPSIVAMNKLRSDYNMVSTHFIIVNDSVNGYKLREMTSRLEDVDGVEDVLSYCQYVTPSMPDFFVPQDIKDIFKAGGYQMIMVNSKYKVTTKAVSDQLSTIRGIVTEYDPNAYITGEAPLTEDMITIADKDFRVTNYISIAAIFLIVALVFKSLTVPVVLVSAIELAIFINEGIPYFTGATVPFIAPTVISCVQLGATVDYAILMTTRFREEIQSGKDRREAIRIAATTSDPSIITSSLVLFCATLGVGLISTIEIISSICIMLARGALISAFVCIFILPSLLLIFEPVFAHTSLNWRHPPVPKLERIRRAYRKVRGKQSSAAPECGDPSSPDANESPDCVGAGVQNQTTAYSEKGASENDKEND